MFGTTRIGSSRGEMEPDNPAVLYNVACVFVQLGNFDEALDLLERNVAQGWGEKQWIEHDPDSYPLRENPRFRAILDRIRPA